MAARSILKWCAAMAMTVAFATAAQADMSLSGYTQARFDHWDNNMGKSSDNQFEIGRARLKAVADVNPDTTITLQLGFAKLVNDESGSGNVELKDALITRHLNPEWTATLGYTQMPFGYEVPSSDAANWTFIKSYVMNELFPGERDTGLYFHYRPTRPHRPWFDIGFSDGPHKWYTADSHGNRDTSSHALVARLQLPLAHGSSAAVSYMKAERQGTVGGVPFDFSNSDVWGADVNLVSPHKWNLRGEYFNGHVPTAVDDAAVNQKVNGWYAFGSYTLSDKPVTFFYRYDTFDAHTANNYARHTVGVGWEGHKNERLTFLVERITNDGSTEGLSDTNFGLQWQVKY